MDLKQGTSGATPGAPVMAPAESDLPRQRKPYQKPAFRFERVFETMALSCGKLNVTDRMCRSHRKTS